MPDSVHDLNAKLFFAKEGSRFPPVVEDIQNCHGGVHLVYATINGKTHVIERKILQSLISFEMMQPSKEPGAPLHSFIEKPLEVFAVELSGTDVGKYPKWHIWMLRDGKESGFIDDHVAHVLGGGK